MAGLWSRSLESESVESHVFSWSRMFSAGVACFQLESESGVGVGFLKLLESESGVGVGFLKLLESESGVGVGFLKLLESESGVGVGFSKLLESESGVGVGTFVAITDSKVY